jgi:hypothetical protein
VCCSAVAVAIACDVSVVDGDVVGQWWECVATAVVTGDVRWCASGCSVTTRQLWQAACHSSGHMSSAMTTATAKGDGWSAFSCEG